MHQPPPVHQVFEGAQLRDLQLRAAQGRLPPAGRAGALLPLQRRLRRGHVLRRRRLRGAQGLGHRQGLDLACTRAGTATARSPARSSGRSARSTSTSSPSWSTPSGRSSSARPARRVGRRALRLVLVGPGTGRMSWLELPAGHRLRASTTCRYGVVSTPATAAPASAWPSATSVTRRRSTSPRRTGDAGRTRDRLARPVPGAGRPGLARRCASGITELAGSPTSGTAPRASRTCAPRDDGDAAPAVRRRRLRRLLQLASTTPRTSAGCSARTRRPADAELEAPADRLPRPRRHGRRLRARRWSGRAASARAAGRRGADVRAVRAAGHRGRGRASSSARAPRSGTPVPLARLRRARVRRRAWSTTGPPATCRPGSTCRWARSSASRSPPRSRRGWCRWPRWRRARVAPPARDAALLPYLRDDGRPWGLDLALEVRLNGT